MVGALEAGAGPEIVTWPMLLAGLGVGALASQLGSVTVSSVADEQSGEVGGLQNTVTNLGASIGTALAGAVLIAALSTSFLTGVQHNAAVPADVKSKATVELAGGVPFVSDTELRSALEQAGTSPEASNAIVKENETARLAGTALVAVGAGGHRFDRVALQSRHPDRAARHDAIERAIGPVARSPPPNSPHQISPAESPLRSSHLRSSHLRSPTARRSISLSPAYL